MSSADPSRPRILVFAGPNGSGKSTITKKIPICGIYVNADEIKRITRCTDLEAAQEAEQIRLSLLSAHKDFTFETVLSTDRNLALLRQAKEMGYEIQAVFILTNDPADMKNHCGIYPGSSESQTIPASLTIRMKYRI